MPGLLCGDIRTGTGPTPSWVPGNAEPPGGASPLDDGIGNVGPLSRDERAP
jgi:hypothetical protein